MDKAKDAIRIIKCRRKELKNFNCMLSLIMLVASSNVAAQSSAAAFPSKTIRVVVAFVPGGITDIVGRTAARHLEDLGQQVIVENRGGAGGQVGSAYVARAVPDGYTLLIGSLGTHGIAPSLYQKLGYDSVKDYAHVSMLATTGNLLVIHPSIPAKNVRELIALAKNNPGKLNYAAVGGTSHLSTELFNTMAGIKTTNIPYKGAAPATVALLSGEIDLMLHAFSGLLPHVRTGKLRALGVTTDKRSPIAPDIPTLSEAGVTGYNASGWFSLLAPAGTPDPIVLRLNQSIRKGFESKETVDFFAKQNTQIMVTTPADALAFLRSEIDKWARVVKAAGIQPE